MKKGLKRFIATIIMSIILLTNNGTLVLATEITENLTEEPAVAQEVVASEPVQQEETAPPEESATQPEPAVEAPKSSEPVVTEPASLPSNEAIPDAQNTAEEAKPETQTTEVTTPEENVSKEIQDETVPEAVQEEAQEEPKEEPKVQEDVLPNDAEETDKDEENKEEVILDAEPRVFTGHVNSVDVKVTAEPNTFPVGTTWDVKEVSKEKVIGDVEKAIGETVEDVKAVDITFFANGNEVQPAKPVKVELTTTAFQSNEDLKVVHIEEPGKAEKMNLTEATDTKATFNTDGFSVYVVVDTGDYARLTVNFKNGNDTKYTVQVKKADISTIDTVIVDPSDKILPLGEGVTFLGWSKNPSYAVDASGDVSGKMDIAGVREDVSNILNQGISESNTETNHVDYYAVLVKTYKINYVDENGISQGGSEINFRADASNEQSYTVNMAYTPQDNEHNFDGWFVKEGSNHINGYTAGNKYSNGTDITVTGDVTFSVSAPLGHWLVFDENGKGATYVAPQFIKTDEVTANPNVDMVRKGYTFGGWYKDQACTPGQEFTFGNTIDELTTVYAKWTAATTANYTVIIWKQNIAGDGYDYVEAIQLSGTVNTTINTVTQEGTGNNAYAKVNDVNKQYTGFHLKEFDQNVTIAPEGNSIVNVYFDRNSHTLKFQVQDYTYTPTTSNNGTQYGLVDGEYVELTRHGRNNNYYWTYGDFFGLEGTRYSGTRYTRSNNQSWQDIKEINALYGQSIGNEFPIVGTNGVTYDNGERWSPQNSTTFNQVLVYIDIMPDEDVTFRLSTTNNGTKNIYYYVEAIPGSQVDRSYDGKDFVLYKHVAAKYGFFTEAEDYLELNGFTKYDYTPSNAWGSGSIFNPSPDTVYCYYTRDKYKINFMDGSYFDGNGVLIQGETDQGQLGTSSEIYFDADVSSYKDYRPSTSPAGYVFEGWYIDKECTHPYTFNKMPDGGITVYAKWRQIQYRVFIHPNAGTDPTLDLGSEDQATNFRVSYGGQVSLPNIILRTGYEFVGWYSDEACTIPFNAEAFVLNDQTVTTEYDKTKKENYTDPSNKWGNENATENKDVDRFWITKKFDVYAKWRSILEGADGIFVKYVYENDAGEQVVRDSTLYVDQATAVAMTTPEAPTNKVFDKWELQKQEGTQSLNPGQSFTVLKNDAEVKVTKWENPNNATDIIEIAEPEPGLTPPDAIHTKINKATYTITIRAVYKDVEEETPTHIYWYRNDGTAGPIADYTYTNISINQGVAIRPALTRAGYDFAGWAKVSEEADYATHVYNNVSGEPLVWYKDGNYYRSESYTEDNIATQVAADEFNGHDVLIAVWTPRDDTNYTVKHWKQDLDPATNLPADTYTEVTADRETLTGTTGAEATYTPKTTYIGFTFDDSKTTPAAAADRIIAADGSTVINLYYTRNTNVKYRVEHYQQNLDGTYPTEPTETENDKTGTVGQNVVAVDKGYAGFTLDLTVEGTKQRGTIVGGEEVLVLKLYYARNTYTVKYLPGEHGTFAAQETAGVKYGAPTPAAPEATGAAGYTFAGWDTEPAATVTANATYTATWTANTNTKYTVKHWQQNIDNDEYTEVVADQEEKTGTTDRQTEATAKTYEGFTAKDIEQQTIKGDGTTVVNVYYDRNKYTVVYLPGDHGDFEAQTTENIKYGATTPTAPATTGEPGYTFDAWTPSVAPTVTANATYTATWTANTNTKYTVKHWQQNIENDEYTEVVADQEEKTGTTDKQTEATAKTYEGFTAKDIEQQTIKGDGTTVVNVYYDRNKYTVVYLPGDHGDFEAQTTENIKYGATTPTAPATTGEPGYTFDAWTPSVAPTVTANATYTATWTANTNTKYTVKHWQQNIENDEYTEVVADQEEKTGTTDKQTEATAKTYEGFTAKDIEQQTIKGDGTTVVNVYYDRNKYTVVYLPGDHGDFEAQTTENIKYGATTPAAPATTGEPGYTFDAWTPSVAPTVTANATYTATWTANTNTKYTVKHWQQNIENDEYTEVVADQEEKTGTTDKQTEATAKTYEGFTAKDIEQQTIKGDGTTVVNVYYDRNKYTVVYLPGDHGDFEAQTTENIKYGATTPTAPATTGEPGYTFDAWTPSVAPTVTANATYTATWTANTNTKYTVKHWQQNIENDEYTEVVADQEEKTGTTDKQTEATAKTYEGFTAKDIEQQTIKGDGTTVVNVYYDRNKYTVVYLPGDHGDFEAQTTENIKYGATTPTAPATTGAAGYTFDKWSPLPASTVTEDATYTALWTANPATPYITRYYTQILNSTEYEQYGEDVPGTGTTDSSVEADIIAIEGFLHDAENPNRNESDIIRGDGNTVLAVYYNRIIYHIESSVDGSNGVIDPVGTTDVQYDGSQAYSFEPADGYTIKSVLVDETTELTTYGQPRTELLANGYTFSNVDDDHKIVVSFSEDENKNNIPDDEEFFTITPSVDGGHGTIDPDEVLSYVYGSNATYNFEPDNGYTIKSLKVDRIEQTTPGESREELLENGYTFGKIVKNYTIVVKYGEDRNNNDIPDDEENHYIITATAGENGSVDPEGETDMIEGESLTIDITPDGGYTIKSLKVDDQEQTTPGKSREEFVNNGYTFADIRADHKLHVTFAEDENTNNIPDDEEYFKINSSVDGEHGTITPEGETEYVYGSVAPYTFGPDDGYTIKSLLVDNEEQTAEGESREELINNGYTFGKVTDNHKIVVKYGEDRNNNDIPDDEENHYIITATAGDNGSVDPEGETDMIEGESLTIDITPDGGYTIKSLKVDDQEQTTPGKSREEFVNNGYTFADIRADHKLHVTFAEDENTNNIPDDEEYFKINSSVDGEHGTITPEGETEYVYGSVAPYTFGPDEGYTIKSLLVDNEEQTAEGESREELINNGYTFGKVTDNHKIVVKYGEDRNNNDIPDDEENHYIITATAGDNGSVDPEGETDMIEGESLTIDITPDGGYTIKSLKVDDQEQTTPGKSREEFVNNGYTFADIRADHKLHVTFAEDENTNNIPDDEEYFKINSSVDGEHGTITPEGETEYVYGSVAPYTFGPDDGYTIKSLLVDNEEQTAEGESREELINNGYTFGKVTDNHKIVVKYGEDRNNNDIPDDEENHYIITATAGDNGSVDPEGETDMIEGESLTIDITPDEGYTIKSLTVDDEEQTTEGESREEFVENGYTFADIRADHKLHVTFAEDENTNNIPDDEEYFKINSSVDGEHGTITPEGETEYVYGSVAPYTFGPDDGYTIKSLLVDNEEQTAEGESREELINNGYTFGKVTDNHKIVVKYGEDRNNNDIPDDEENHYIITATAGDNGSVDPEGETDMIEGESLTIDITPDEGYTIKSLTVDDEEQTTEGESREEFVENGYTFENITDNHTLNVTFAEDDNDNNIPDDEEPFVPVENDPPVKKNIKGDTPDAAATFRFELEAIETTAEGVEEMPMPEGSKGNKKTIDVVGGGEYEFGIIKFEVPGIYTYKMTEKALGTVGYKYDGSTYIVTYVVEEEGMVEAGRKLVCERTITKDGKEADACVFTNEYTKPASATPGEAPHSEAPQTVTTTAGFVKTGDNATIYFIILVIAIFSLAISFKVEPKTEKTSKKIYK